MLQHTKDILFETGSQTGKHDLRRIISIRQVFIWTFAHEAHPVHGDVLEYGWRRTADGLVPVLFNGPTSVEKIDSFTCQCNSQSNGHVFLQPDHVLKKTSPV